MNNISTLRDTKVAALTRQKFTRGVTLIELMIALVIVAILAAIALPSYRQYVVRSNRTAAQSEMMDVANWQEQYFFANRVYANATTMVANGFGLPTEVSGNYTYSVAVGTGTVPSYTITFAPKGGQAGDGSLTLTNTGVKAPAEKW